MSLVNTLMSGSGVVPTYEGFLPMDELYTGRVCDNYLESYVIDELNEAAVDELVANQEACLVADVIGEVNVIKEGANPQILMEGIFESIKNAIKTFFEKIADFFKNLFTSSKKKAEERARSEEADKIRNDVSALRAELKDSQAKAKLYSGAVSVSMYKYAPDMFKIYNQTADSIADIYAKAMDDYQDIFNHTKDLIDTMHSDYDRTGGKKNGKFSYYDEYDANGRHHNSSEKRTRDGLRGVATDVNNIGKSVNSELHGSSDGDDTAKKAWENKNSSKTRHDEGYHNKTNAEKALYDADVANLEEKYNATKRPIINGVRLTDDEAKMSLADYIKYLMRGKNTSKKEYVYQIACDTVCAAIGVSDITDDAFEDVAVNGGNNAMLKAAYTTANKKVQDVRRTKLKIDTMIKDAESSIKKKADGAQDIQNILTKISNYTRQHATDLAKIAHVGFNMAEEISGVCRSIIRVGAQIAKAVGPTGYNDELKDMSDWEKERYKKATRESYGLFEQAYATGLI